MTCKCCGKVVNNLVWYTLCEECADKLGWSYRC